MRELPMNKSTVGWMSMALGLVIALTPTWAQTTAVGAGFTLGLGAMTVMYGGWSLIARDPTRDHWAMSVVGLVLAIAPWIGGYAGDGAAWVSWIGGVALMVLAGAAYIADEAGAVTATERIKALAKYQAQHGISPHDATTVPTQSSTPPTSIPPGNSSTHCPFAPDTVPTTEPTQSLPVTPPVGRCTRLTIGDHLKWARSAGAMAATSQHVRGWLGASTRSGCGRTSITRGASRGGQPGEAQFWFDERIEPGRQPLVLCVGLSTGGRGMVEQSLQQPQVYGATHLGVGSGEFPYGAGVQPNDPLSLDDLLAVSRQR